MTKIYEKRVGFLNALPQEPIIEEHKYPCGCVARMFQASEVLLYCSRGGDCKTARAWRNKRRIR